MESSSVLLLMKAMVLCSLTSAVICEGAFCEGACFSGGKNGETKRFLKSLSKPAVTTIEADNGDLFDCVDINKQPAFDHPLLKNHTIQMTPSSYPTRSDNFKYAPVKAANIVFPKEGCPIGTVPIRRVKKREFRSFMSLKDFEKKTRFQNGSTTSPNDGGLHIYTAGLHTNGMFYGAKMYMNVWEPDIRSSTSNSIAQFEIGNGPADRLGAGWVVDGSDNKDHHARLFVFWENERERCVNTACPGFVHISRNIALGSQIYPVSKYGGDQFEIPLMAHLSFGEDPSPEMGSGDYAESGYKKACFMRAIEVVTEGNKLVDPPPTQLQSAIPCFSVMDLGHTRVWGKTFYFGGPGAGGPCPSPLNQL